MPIGYFNELSLQTVNHSVGPWLVDQLLQTTEAALLRIRATPDSLDRPWIGGRSLRVVAVSSLETTNRDLGRRLINRFLEAQPIEEAEQTWLHGGIPAHGLDAARRADALAVSLATVGWHHAHVDIHRPTPPPHVARVRHACAVGHVREHLPWLEEGEPPEVLLRRRFKLTTAVHVPAMEYRSGKHVVGASNEARRKRAMMPGGNGQFLHADARGTIGDRDIAAWERAALTRLDQGDPDLIVRRQAEAFHLYAQLDHVIGYEGGTGVEISWIRVDVSGHFVHSHPRTPDR